MILEKYFEIIDRPSEEISRMWKIGHIFFIATGAITGYASSCSFQMCLKQFSDNCILYPIIAYKNKTENATVNTNTQDTFISVDLIGTRWGEEWLCAFCEFVPLMSVILGPILIAFFMILPRGGTNFNKSCSIGRSWHLVVPCILLSGIFIAILIASLTKLTNGITVLCAELETTAFKNYSYHSEICRKLINKFSQELTAGVHARIHGKAMTYSIPAYTNILMTINLLFACIICWILTFLTLVFRVLCVVDFKIVEVVIESQEESEETLIKNTKYTSSDSESTVSETITVEVNNIMNATYNIPV